MSVSYAQKRGSEESSEPRYLIIGRITRPHGIRGEVRVEVRTDQPERFNWLERVFVGKDLPTPISIERVRFHKKMIILKLAGVDSRSQAEEFRNRILQVPIDEAVPLKDGEFYLYQLDGLQVETVEGEILGHLVEVLQTGANDVFLIKGPAGELLVPDIPDVVLEIDIDAGRILVQLPPGLRD